MSKLRKKFGLGVLLKPSTSATTKEGELRVDPSDMKFKAYLDSAERSIVTEDQTQTLTNKTIEDITLDGDLSGTAILDEDDMVSDSDTKLATQQSIKAYVDAQIQSKDEASEIAYDNTTSGLVATDVQAAVDEVEARVDQNEVDIASNESDITDNAANIATNTSNISTNASTISEVDQNVDDLITLSGVAENSTDLGTFTGTTIADNETVKGALQDLEDGIEAIDVTSKVDKVSPSTDNAIVRFDGVTGDQQDSGVTINDLDEIEGATKITVDLLEIDSNSISNVSANPVTGDIVLTPLADKVTLLEEGSQLRGDVSFESYVDTTTGSNATLIEPEDTVASLTSDALVSIDMIPRVKTSNVLDVFLILQNNSTTPKIINNETGATAGDQIITGTGAAITLEAGSAISLIYNTNKNKWQVLGGTGSGTGGSGGFNYIENGTAETDTAGWTVYANTTPDTRPDDFGGTPSGNLTFTQNTTNPLVEDADFKLSKTASNVQGEGVYYQFTAEEGHKTLKNLLKLIADTSALDDGDLTFYLVSSSDSFVADFNIISPNNPDLIAGSPQILKQFQFDASDDDYRLCIHYASTDTDAKDAYFDDIELGPRETATGYFGTDSVAWTPTGTHTTNTTYSGFYKRDGESISGEIYITYSGTPDATTLDINLPFTVDTAKLASTERPLGKVRVNDASQGNVFGVLELSPVDDGKVRPLLPSFDSDESSNVLYTITNNWNGAGTNRTIVSGDEVYISFEDVPIQGWSSNAVSSEDFGSREIVVEGAGNGGTSITANVTDIDFTETRDTTSSWNGTQFTAPESGDYLVNGSLNITISTALSIYAYINGTQDKRIKLTRSAVIHDFSNTIYLEKGDMLSLRSSQTVTLSNVVDSHHIHIAKLASPQTILEAETVAFRATSDSGQSIPNSTATTVVFEDVEFDTHGAYDNTTGEYEAPTSGYYQINSNITYDNFSSDSGLYTLRIVVDGVENTRFAQTIQRGTLQVATLSSVVYLSKGQVIKIDTSQSNGGSRTFSSNSKDVTFSLVKIK